MCVCVCMWTYCEPSAFGMSGEHKHSLSNLPRAEIHTQNHTKTYSHTTNISSLSLLFICTVVLYSTYNNLPITSICFFSNSLFVNHLWNTYKYCVLLHLNTRNITSYITIYYVDYIESYPAQSTQTFIETKMGQCRNLYIYNITAVSTFKYDLTWGT